MLESGNASAIMDMLWYCVFGLSLQEWQKEALLRHPNVEGKPITQEKGRMKDVVLQALEARIVKGSGGVRGRSYFSGRTWPRPIRQGTSEQKTQQRPHSQYPIT